MAATRRDASFPPSEMLRRDRFDVGAAIAPAPRERPGARHRRDQLRCIRILPAPPARRAGYLPQERRLLRRVQRPETGRGRCRRSRRRPDRGEARAPSLLAALREGRAASKSTLTFDACLDQYLDVLERGGAREKTVRTMRGIADRRVRPSSAPSRCRRSRSPMCGPCCVRSRTCPARRRPRFFACWRGVRGRDPRGRPRPLAARQARPEGVAEARIDEEAAPPRRSRARAAPRGREDEDARLPRRCSRCSRSPACASVRRSASPGRTSTLTQGSSASSANSPTTTGPTSTLRPRTRTRAPALPAPAPRARRAQARLVWTAADDPVFAAGRRKPKGYRNVRRALADAVKEAGITSPLTSASRRTRCGTRTRRT